MEHTYQEAAPTRAEIDARVRELASRLASDLPAKAQTLKAVASRTL